MWTLRSPMAVFPAIAFGLGTWQIYRYDRKKRMLEHREARRLAPTEELPHDVDVKDCEFRHFVVRGEFDHARELVVGPRSYEGGSGFYVVTPFVTSDRSVLVNRGWVPRDRKDWHRPDGPQELVGVLRGVETPQTFTPNNTPPQWFWMDLAAMAKHTGRADVLPNYRLDAIRGSRDDEPPIGGQTVFWLPNNHVTYIVTWYSLAGALLAMMAMARRGKLK